MMSSFLFSHIIFLTLATFLVSCGANTNQHSSHENETTSEISTSSDTKNSVFFHSGLGWENSVSILLHQDADSDLEAQLIIALDTWNQAVGKDILLYSGRSSEKRGGKLYDSLRDQLTVIYLEPEWKSSTGKSSGVLGTTIWENSSANSEVIEKADIILNTEKYSFQDALIDEGIIEDSNKNLVDAQTVLIHELGHLLGLNHVDSEEDSDSVMAPYTRIGANNYKRDLSDGDISRINEIYGL